LDDPKSVLASREVVRVLGALSDENRFRIVELLAPEGAELSCGAVCEALGLSPSLVSHHLSILQGAGVIARRKNGLWTLNYLRRDVLAAHIARLGRLVDPVPAS
jgi:ArsR family transcriptional regulator, arsenate/arsenite/antimonite-responsive transcriptional repressor